MKSRTFRCIIHILFFTAVLSPLSWGRFITIAQNVFSLSAFGTGDMVFCLVLSLLPMLFFFLGLFLQKKTGPVWGSALACVCFLLAVAAWSYTMVDQWNSWQNAYLLGSITRQQEARLRAVSLVGFFSALIPIVSQIPGYFRKK
mgnify:CR=1 FL=1